jgi:hypothetical protein
LSLLKPNRVPPRCGESLSLTLQRQDGPRKSVSALSHRGGSAHRGTPHPLVILRRKAWPEGSCRVERRRCGLPLGAFLQPPGRPRRTGGRPSRARDGPLRSGRGRAARAISSSFVDDRGDVDRGLPRRRADGVPFSICGARLPLRSHGSGEGERSPGVLRKVLPARRDELQRLDARILPRIAWHLVLRGQRFDGWLPSRLIPHRHRSRAELQPAHELQVDTLR